jgi:hypothetical protein
MNQIGLHEKDWHKHFKLMADIDLSAYTATEFNIIGYYRTVLDERPFQGVFDGNGHTISSFTYISPAEESVAIFHRVSNESDDEGGEIRNLGLIDPNVHAPAGSVVATLVSNLALLGKIRNCYVRGGNVTGGNVVGGLVGRNDQGWIENCYASTNVSGDDYVGGLLADNFDYVSADSPLASIVTNSYSTSSVSGNEHVGGLVGANLGIIFNSYWDVETSGQDTSAGGVGRTTVEMRTAETFLGWGSVGHEVIWTIDEGNDYPRLSWENQSGRPIEPDQLSDLLAGTGTQADPLLIYTAEELNTIGLFPSDWDKHYKLMADIDLASHTGMEFNMIGNENACYDRPPFTGVFDGGDHTIANFSYTFVGDGVFYPTGLFSRVDDPNAQIRNLRLVDPNVDAGMRHYVGSLVGLFLSGNLVNCHVEGGKVVGQLASVGGLVGSAAGIISNCSSSVMVEGSSSVGGLAGYNGGRTASSYSTGSVDGRRYIGGLVGSNMGTLADCYATGSVSGNEAVGGLVGDCLSIDGAAGVITNCYSAGRVSGGERVAGLVSEGRFGGGGSASACFWDVETSGQLTGLHGTGKSTAEMQTAATFLEAGWDFVGETANGTEDICWILDGQDYPRLWWELLE